MGKFGFKEDVSDIQRRRASQDQPVQGELSTIDALHGDLSMRLSRLHKPELKQEEQEILDFFRDWQNYCKYRFNKDPDAGKAFYDIPEVMYHDLMGNGARGDFEDHYDRIGPYLANAQIGYKDLEITAVSKEFGYATMIQRYWGKTKDGIDFDFKYRIIGLLAKTDSKWQWVHEHISFPVDLKTKMADFECGLAPKEALCLGDKSWGDRPLDEVKLPQPS